VRFGVAVAAFFFFIAALTFRESLRTSPILVIGPEGLTYAPFCSKPVPWSGLAEVTLVRYEAKVVNFPGKVVYYWQPNSEMVNFAVSEPKLYPSGPGRGFNRFAMTKMYGLPPISIQVYYVKDATLDAIGDAIRKHWSGRIERKDFTYPRQSVP
jgi:hypothetical protein